jgi:hypothetical protein
MLLVSGTKQTQCVRLHAVNFDKESSTMLLILLGSQNAQTACCRLYSSTKPDSMLLPSVGRQALCCWFWYGQAPCCWFQEGVKLHAGSQASCSWLVARNLTNITVSLLLQCLMLLKRRQTFSHRTFDNTAGLLVFYYLQNYINVERYKYTCCKLERQNVWLHLLCLIFYSLFYTNYAKHYTSNIEHILIPI